MNSSPITETQPGYLKRPSFPDVQAIREAINAARENKDNASLLFSLAWLDQFVKRANTQDKIEISISREDSLQYLKVKAKEANLPHLLGVVTLLEAQQLIRSVRRVMNPLMVRVGLWSQSLTIF